MPARCSNGCGRQTDNAGSMCTPCATLAEMLPKEREEDRENLACRKVMKSKTAHKGENPAHFPLELRGGEEKEEIKKVEIMKGCNNIIDGKQCGRPVQKEKLCYKCYSAKHGHPPFGKAAKNKTQVSSSAPGSKKGVNIGQGGKESEPETKVTAGASLAVPQREKQIKTGQAQDLPLQEPATYLVSVNFTRYPKLRQRLIQMAEENFREPGMQLLALVHGTLSKMEASV